MQLACWFTEQKELFLCGPVPFRCRFLHVLCRRNRPPPHLRDHLASRCGQDHADRKVPALRQRHPPRRRRQGPQEPARHHLRLDGARAPARHLHQLDRPPVRLRRLRRQPPRHPRPQGLFRGHLPRAHRGGRRRHGHRRRQGHRGADAQALRGLPPPRRAHLHVHEQVRPPHAQSDRAARRARERARAARQRGRSGRSATARRSRASSTAARARCISSSACPAALTRPPCRSPASTIRSCATGSTILPPRGEGTAGHARRGRRRLRSRRRARRTADGGLFRQRRQQLRRAAHARRIFAGLRAAQPRRNAANSKRPKVKSQNGQDDIGETSAAASVQEQTPRLPLRSCPSPTGAFPASSSRSRPTWNRSTATASPSCACARANSARHDRAPPAHGENLRLSSSHKLFGKERETVNEAYPGDVIGLLGHDSSASATR